MIPYFLIGAVAVMGVVYQLHDRRTRAVKSRTRDERWQARLNAQRAALREQWQVEEAKYQGEIKALRTQIESLTAQVFKLATDTMEKDAGSIVKEVADLVVRITQGDPGPQVPYQNLADMLAGESGAEQPETAGSKLFVPEHEQDILAWANDAMPTRGGWVEQQEKEQVDD